MLHKLTTFFLYAFVADGVVSVVDILSRQNSASIHPNLFGATLSTILLLLALALFAGMVFTPRLSKRLLLPPILFLGCSLVWAVIFGDRGGLLINMAQVFLGMGMIVGFRDRSTSRWSIQNFAATRPLFTFKNFLVTALLNGAIGAFFVSLLALCLTQDARLQMEDSTGRFLTIQRTGISLEERTFRREGREIRLISMMHIAKSGFYDEVARTLPSTASAVVLLEGVSDNQHRLNGKLDYARIARLFGFASQRESSFSKKAWDGLQESASNQASGRSQKNLEYLNADIDLSELSPETVNFIQATGKLLNSPTIRDALKTYSDSQATFQTGAKTFNSDILEKRNQHLLGMIRQSLEKHTLIIVPWGALHMPGIQEKIQEWGFVETKRSQHQAVRFRNKMIIGLITILDQVPANPM